jgi:hypothetical protein
MARVLTGRSETGSPPVPLATESLAAYRLDVTRIEVAAVRELASLKSAQGH